MKYVSTFFALMMLIPAGQAKCIEVQATVGTNYWGNTVGLGFKHFLSDRWGIGITVTSGNFRLSTSNQGDFLVFKNLPGDEHRATLELKQLIDLAAYFKRVHQERIRMFGEVGIGLTHVFVRFKSEYNENGVVGTFKAEQDYSKYGLFVSLNVVDFDLTDSNKAILSLGIKSKLLFWKGPETLDYDNNVDTIVSHELWGDSGSTLYFPYPELFASLALRL